MNETTSLYRGSPGKIFLQYAAPQALALLANTGYAIVDGVFIGARLGPSALAATGVAVPAFELLIALSMAATAGAGVVASTRLAEGDRERAVRAFNTSMALQGAIGLAIVVLSNIFMDSLVRFLGAPSEIHDATATYLRYLLSFSPFLLYGYMLGGLARNDGRPGLAAAALTIGSVANILLDYVFMYPLNMGIAGAALASGIGPVVSVLILLPHFLTERKGVLLFKRVRLSFSDAGRILKLGVPSFVLEFSIGTVTFVMNYGIVRYGYGSNGLAVYLIVGYLALVVLTLFYGMAEGLQPAFSYLCAAGERKKLRSNVHAGLRGYGDFCGGEKRALFQRLHLRGPQYPRDILLSGDLGDGAFAFPGDASRIRSARRSRRVSSLRLWRGTVMALPFARGSLNFGDFRYNCVSAAFLLTLTGGLISSKVRGWEARF